MKLNFKLLTICSIVILLLCLVSCGHEHVLETLERVEPTCTQNGKTAGKICVDCGEIVVAQQVIPAKGHKAGKWIVAEEPTCEVNGTENQICSVCNEILISESLPALGHNYKAATCTEAKTCKTCGATEGSALGHDYTAATCTEPQKCRTCGITSGTALGHDYKAATCTEPKKCKTCGITSGTALGHNYKAATCTEPKKCRTCGITSGSALGHNYKAATCTEPKKCKTCGATSGTVSGHNYKAATCTEPKKCRTCGITSGTALGHNYKAATCTEPKKCTRCYIVEGTKISHIYSGGKCIYCGVSQGTNYDILSNYVKSNGPLLLFTSSGINYFLDTTDDGYLVIYAFKTRTYYDIGIDFEAYLKPNGRISMNMTPSTYDSVFNGESHTIVVYTCDSVNPSTFTTYYTYYDYRGAYYNVSTMKQMIQSIMNISISKINDLLYRIKK